MDNYEKLRIINAIILKFIINNLTCFSGNNTTSAYVLIMSTINE